MNPKYKSLFLYVGLLTIVFLVVHLIGQATPLQSNITWLLWMSFVFYVSRAISNQLWERLIRHRSPLPIEQVHPKGKAVLITGCDTGFGHRLAQQLLDYGFTVFAGCLRSDSAGAKKLKTYGKSNKIFILDMDVTNEQSVQNSLNSFKSSLEGNNLQLYALINNAGNCLKIDLVNQSIIQSIPRFPIHQASWLARKLNSDRQNCFNRRWTSTAWAQFE